MKILMSGLRILLTCFVAPALYAYADDQPWENNISNGHHNPVLSTAPLIVEISWYSEKDFKPPPGAIEEGGRISMSFSLPSDCSKIQLFSDLEPLSATYNLSSLFGAWAYCKRVDRLRKGSLTANYDYVSDLDYTSLPLDLIPAKMGCQGVVGGSLVEYCDYVYTNPQTNKLSFAHAEVRTKTPLPVDRETCHLTDSKFMGGCLVKNGRIVCSKDTESYGIELYDCQFRDVNHDGYMDVVLSFIQRGAGAGGRLTFTLTRLKKNGPLFNITNLDQ